MVATCQVCGRRHSEAAPAGARPTHWVTDDVLACFNLANVEAERRGMAEVGLAHLLLAMASLPAAGATLQRSGLEAVSLAAMVGAALPPSTQAHGIRDATAARPAASQDVKTLLDIADRSTRLAGQTHISMEILLSTLLSLPSALASVHDLSRWLWAARAYPGAAEETRAFLPMPTRAWSRATDGSAPVAEAGRDWLEARLERQERMLSSLQAEMRALVGELQTRLAAAARAPVPPPAAAPPTSTATEPPKTVAAVALPKPEPIVDDVTEDDDLDDEEAQATGIKRYYLSMDDEIVRAPSIGPATAARLQPHGITHVKHLLAVDPERLSARLGARHLTASRIAAWKNQARLVCSIPWLRGTHAQLLVGAGYASIEKILSADRPVVCAAIMQFATTRDGQSILRNGQPPEMDRIMRWIENSQQAEPQRAEPARSMTTRIVN